MAAILAAYAAALLVLPPTAPTPLIDDWNYLISVRRLVEDGEVWVAPWTATTLLLQIGWGALFALPFGVGPEALRLSTLVASLGGTLACVALFRELGVSRGRASVGAMAVWFNPLVFALSYTFMTDVPFLALLSASAWATVRAARFGSLRWLAVGSGLAGLAFLVRQQGVLLPLATVVWLVAVRPGWFAARWGRGLAAALGPCLAAVALYVGWARWEGLPPTQGDYLDTLRTAGIGGTLDFGWRLGTVAAFYLGLFVLPPVAGAIGALPGAWRRAGRPTRHAALLWLVGAAIWTRWYAGRHEGLTFPFVPWGSILGFHGLGVTDADGERPILFDPWVYAAVAALAALSAAAALVLVAGRRGAAGDDPAAGRRGAFWRGSGGLLAALGAGQAVGIVPPSLFIRQAITFDRYLLPLLPFALGLVLWALRGERFAFPGPAAALAVFALVGVVGCQDWFAFKRVQAETATWLVEERGIPERQVDGAVQWDGPRWYEYGLAHPEDRLPHRPDDPWWLHIVAPMIDPVYVVAASPEVREGYEVWGRRSYDSWLRGEGWVYVWRREGGSEAAAPA